jgi:two-component system, cell cycle sensor histidine kinase and response regulator CckA
MPRASDVFEHLVAHTQTGVVVVDRAHAILAWNPGAERLFGWSAAEACGRDVATLLAPPGSPLRRYIGAALMGDVVQSVAVMLRRKDGEVVKLILGGRGADPAHHDMAVLFIDETARQQSLATSLAHRTEELQAIIGAFPDLLLWADAEGRVLDFHVGTEVDLPAPAPRILGHRPVDAFPGPIGKLLQDAITTARQDARTVAVEYALPAGGSGARGVAGQFEARMVPLGNDRVVVVVRDITPQRRMEERARRTEKLEAIGRLAGGVAHDFNNLLTVMQMGIAEVQDDIAKRRVPGTETIADLADAAERAGALVRQLLVMGRRQPAIPQSIELNAFVSEHARLLARLLGDSVKLAVELAPEQIWVAADPAQLEQVLYNLCTNARDAMPKGGRATVRVEFHPPVGENAGEPGTGALVVQDEGTGMDAATLERMFEPFFTTKEENGTGLGLATVYGIVQASGGRIEVMSEVGAGTTITVLLPSRGPEPPQDPAT